jgi:hypothetical protein
MQHTVIALFDSYDEAEVARGALVSAGFERDDIALKPRCEPTYASDATSAAAADASASEGVLADIERFFAALFESAPPPHEVAQYAEAVRRGAIMLSVDAATDAHAEVARTMLAQCGAIDIEARAATWHAPDDTDAGAAVRRRPADDETVRAHSPLEELGIRRAPAVRQRGPVRSYQRSAAAPAASARDDDAAAKNAASEAAVTSMAAGSAPGMGAIFSAGRHERPVAATATEAPAAAPAPTAADTRSVTDPLATAAAAAPAGAATPIPDEFIEYEEDFRGRYETKYAADGSRHDDYASAYRHGATGVRNARGTGGGPSEDFEPHARRARKRIAPHRAWARIKTAVRHGWERVTHHGHRA